MSIPVRRYFFVTLCVGRSLGRNSHASTIRRFIYFHMHIFPTPKSLIFRAMVRRPRRCTQPLLADNPKKLLVRAGIQNKIDPAILKN